MTEMDHHMAGIVDSKKARQTQSSGTAQVWSGDRHAYFGTILRECRSINPEVYSYMVRST
jgi:hypothetical protein